VRWELSALRIARFERVPVPGVVDRPQRVVEVSLAEDALAELAGGLRVGC
jgi:hypothetical protein